MPIRPVEDDRWQKRATRARRLAGERPVAEDALVFYAALVEAQGTLVRRYPQALVGGSVRFADELDPGALLRVLPEFLDTIARDAPAALFERIPSISEHDYDRWRHRIQSCWITGGREAWDSDAIHQFILEALLQPFAEVAADLFDPASSAPAACPTCSGIPVVAMLREMGHGARRSLVCGFCLTEWPAPRLVCVGCGESRFDALPVFRTGDFAAVRLDACETCKTYLKTIDLTRDGGAMPIVDDLASLPLDLWAREQGYRRGRPNLLRL